MKNFTITTIALSLLLGATACSAGGPSSEPATTLPASSAPAPAEPKATVETPSETPTPEPAPTPEDDGVATFGETWKYPDGTTISVSKPAASVSTESSTQPGAQLSVFTMSITNGTSKPLQPAAVATVTYGPNGIPAEQVYDSAQGLAQGFDNVILPGKKATIKAAFALPPTEKDVTLTIAPSFEYAEAIFTAK
jgi:hypothetical protein